jgi:hypothetical protein
LKFLQLFLLSLLSVMGFAQDKLEKYELSENLESSWMVYDSKYDSFVPYIASEHSAVKAHTLIIDVESDQNYELILQNSDQDQSLFINGSLNGKISKGELFVLPVISFKKRGQRWAYITVFGSSNIKSKKAYLGYEKASRNNIVSVAKKDVLTMNRRVMSPIRNMTTVSSVIILFFLAFTSGAYPRAFIRFVDFFGIFNARLREAAVFINKPFGRPNMIFLIFLGFLTGFVCWSFYDLGAEVLLSSYYRINGSSFWILLANFLIFCALCYALYFLKLIYIRIVGSIFGVGKIVGLHFFKLIQVSLSILLPGSIVLLIYIYSGYDNVIDPKVLFFWSAGIFYMVRLAAILFALNTNGQIQFHYLITYLCVVELIPIVLGLRFVL